MTQQTELTEREWTGLVNLVRSTPSCKEANVHKARLRQDRERLQQRARQAEAQVSMLRDLVADLQYFITHGSRHIDAVNAMTDRVNVALAATASKEREAA